MSIANELSRLQQAKSDLATSITNKGVTVPVATTIDGYADLIDQIQTGGGGTLPYDAEVEYIESTGTQYIDSGIKPNQNTSVNVGFMLTAVGAVLGARNSNTSNMFIILPRSSASKSVWYYGSGSVQSDAACSLNVYYTASNNNNVLSFGNGNSLTATANNFNCDYNLVLFGMNTANTITKFNSRIYYCRIYNSGTLVRYFIPVRVGQVGYMYDRVSGQLFGNSGTGSFTLGPDVT